MGMPVYSWGGGRQKDREREEGRGEREIVYKRC